MKKSFFELKLLPLTVIVIALFIGSCSTDIMDETESVITEKVESETFFKSGNSSQNQLLAQVRKATAKYHQIEAAIADGYVAGSGCVYNEDLGGMGYHFVNQDLINPVFDPLKPEALLYEPRGDGTLHLVGVEYIVIDAGQDHPYFGNQPLDVGGTPIPIDHYSLHVWIWKANPSGMYSPYNPNVSCN